MAMMALALKRDLAPAGIAAADTRRAREMSDDG